MKRTTLSVVALCAASFFEAVAYGATHTILMKSMQFVPNQLTVAKGDTVVWKNEDPFPHTATSDGNFDTKPIAADKQGRKKLSKVGHFQYHCSLHPTMKAEIEVK